MAGYVGLYPANTYGSICNVGYDNLGFTTTLKSVYDGLGNTCPLQLATNYVNITALKYNGNIVSLAGALTTGGAVTFSGAFSATFTLTAGTSITFPTTGTLATLAGTENFSNKTFTNLTTFSAAINEAKGSDIASATTTDIGAATGTFVDVTGTTTITGLGTIQAGTRRVVRFTGALTLTHNATSLILPGAANITTAAGDVAVFVSLGSGNWVCTSYSKASGYAVLPTTDATITTTDITTNDVSTSKHGWMVKVPGTNTVWLGSGSGSYGQVPLATHVSGTLPVANGGTGVTASDPVIQRVSTSATFATGTTTIPFDNTIPQNTEGDQYMSLSITPKNTNNVLVIQAIASASNSNAAGAAIAMALFQDTTANALVVTEAYNVQNQNAQLVLHHAMTAGTTSATTFKIRIGGNAAGTTSFQGNAGVQIYGGVWAGQLWITEYSA